MNKCCNYNIFAWAKSLFLKTSKIKGAWKINGIDYGDGYKRNFRWVLKIDGFDAWTIKSCQRYVSHLDVVFYDPQDMSISKKLFKMLTDADKVSGKLEILNPDAKIEELWSYSGLKLEYAGFSNLDYGDAGISTINATFIFDKLEIIEGHNV